MNTARILGFNQSHSYIYEGLIEVVENLNGEFITFEEFITLLTNRLVIVKGFRDILVIKKVGDKFFN